jgi:hypothetical protein
MCRFDSWRCSNHHYGHLLWLFCRAGVVTIIRWVCRHFQCFYSWSLLCKRTVVWPGVFTLSGEIYMVLYVTTISDVVAAYCIQSVSVKVLMEIVRLLRTVKLVFHCTSVCVLGCALASVPLPLALWYSADLHPLYLWRRSCKLVVWSTVLKI